MSGPVTALPPSPPRPSPNPQRQASLLERFQGLFPSPASPSVCSSTTSTPLLGEPAIIKPSGPRNAKFLKVRIVTWNMHDSLPKGNLEELLGNVPLYTKPKNPSDALPNFPSDEDHPYHIVVVAGQECPSTLGIPMGFGAGFKLIDKEKDKDWDREEGSNSSQKRDDDEDDDAPKSRKSTDNDAGSPSSGWTAMVEHWLCHGGGAPSSVDSSAQSTTSCSTRKGPYSMLIKQRLMGLYLSVYVHRDVRSLVKGASKSYVKAGLIGGRVGNKGGVGISLNIAGATILFLNAHLAAHEGKVNHRLANLAKIKAELSVEDFLAQDDPRTFSEDLTDKFDYTFIFGDLNFRLDISRLHADWLISHQDYTNALEFDQLRKLLKEKQYFQGFTEALINFPPTFKYDVLRTLKRPHKTKMSYSMSAIPTMVTESEKEGNEHDRAGHDDEDRASISTSFTSQSRVTDAEDDSDIPKTTTSPLLSRAFSTPGSRVSLNAAAHKVKEKWISLLSSPRQKPSSPPALPRSSTQAPILPPINPTAADPLTTSWSLPSLPLVEASTVDDSPPQAPPVVDGTLLQAAPLTRVPSRKSIKDKDAEAGSDDEDRDKGVYDSSHKKRVPSWCDRILFKSTVKPDDPPEGEQEPKPKGLMQQFFAGMLRSRKPSLASLNGEAHTPPSRFVAEPLPSHPSSPPRQSFSHDHLPLRPEKTSQGGMWFFRTNQDSKLRRSMSVASSAEVPPQVNTALRRASVPSGPLITQIPHAPLDGNTPKAPRRRSLLPAFLSGNSSHTNNPSDLATPGDLNLRPRKGDVVCLRYDTLDDKAMRRLEGRSDHRPVIGSYAIYI